MFTQVTKNVIFVYFPSIFSRFSSFPTLLDTNKTNVKKIMLKKYHIFLLVVVLAGNIVCGNGERTKDKMYESIHSTNGCFRRMNATHQIGCSSKRGGSLGVVHYCDTFADLDFILKNGTAGPYIPVLPSKLFHRETVNKLKSSISQVAGVIVHPNNDTLSQFSHEDTCPNNRFSVEQTCSKTPWNPWGTGLLYEDLPFPMFYVDNETEVLKIKECFQKFNNYSMETQKDRSLCSLQLKSFMFATTSTPVCQRRSNIATNLNPIRMCDPLGDFNAWGFLFPLVTQPPPIYTIDSENVESKIYLVDDPALKDFVQKPIKDVKYIVIATRIDTTSMFDVTTGAESPVTGMVTLLTVAKLLKEMVPRDDTIKQNVLFIFFNGETYDYIGSQRLLYDMQTDSFPVDMPKDSEILPLIRPENISLFIELSQLSKGDATYVHYLSDFDNKITNFASELQSNNQADIPVTPVPNSLPPSSLHTFLRANLTIPGVVLTNHKEEFKNRFYNSLYDNESNIGYEYKNGSEISNDSLQKYVGDVALTVAKSVYQVIRNETYQKNVSVDYALVDELFHCYLQNLSCKVHLAIQKPKFLKARHPASLYVGVDVSDNRLTSLIGLTLAWLTGDIVGPGGTDCTNRPKNYAFFYYSMAKSMNAPNETFCYRAVVNTSEAVSPAFIIEDYDWSSNKYSSWSESQWLEMGVRLFLKPSSAHENMTLAIGSMSLIFSFVFVYFVKSRSHILFAMPLPTDGPADC